jgi:glycosyltransferase involved in cell wall biosynthesis
MGRNVSIVIPVYNDPEGIRETVNTICKQTHDRYDVILIDNNSNDKTPILINKLTKKYPNIISAKEEIKIQSSYAARNTGIKHASGDVLIFLDADMWVPETWIESMASALEDKRADYLGCNVEVVADDQPTFWERYEQSFSFPVETYLENKHFAPTCALAVRRKVFDDVGLFDHRLESGGDKEFGQRVHRAGFKQGYAEDVTAYHPARDSFEALRSKALRIGRGRAQMRRHHSDVGDYHHPLHPVNYLPPSPFRLRQRFSGLDASLPSLAGFYLLEYGLKLAQAYGTLGESIELWRSDHEEQ